MSAKIILFMSADSQYIREVIRGIQTFAQTKDWVLHLVSPTIHTLRSLLSWSFDGIIANCDRYEFVEGLQLLNKPTVSIGNLLANLPFVSVQSDDFLTGKLAAQHLAQIGNENFVFVGYKFWEFSQERCRGFQETLQYEYGYTLTKILEVSPSSLINLSSLKEIEDNDFEHYLQKVEKPVGIFCANDMLALSIINFCQTHQLSIPEDITILGVDNDPIYCELCTPSLSSIELPLRLIGFQSAELLEAILKGDHPSNRKLSQIEIIVRQSTEFTSHPHPLMRQALEYIHTHLKEGIHVEEVAHGLKISRRTLERLFQKYLHITPGTYIRNQRIQLAKYLLRSTRTPVKRIAKECGFLYLSTFSEVFRQSTGISPNTYRRQLGSHLLS